MSPLAEQAIRAAVKKKTLDDDYSKKQ